MGWHSALKRNGLGGIHCISACMEAWIHARRISRDGLVSRHLEFCSSFFYALFPFLCLSFSFDIVHRPFRSRPVWPQLTIRYSYLMTLSHPAPCSLKCLFPLRKVLACACITPPKIPICNLGLWRWCAHQKSLAPPVSSPQQPITKLKCSMQGLHPRDVWLAERRAGRGRLAHTKRADCASPMHGVHMRCLPPCMYVLSGVLARTNLVFSACLDR